jgi:hypothetical protein
MIKASVELLVRPFSVPDKLLLSVQQGEAAVGAVPLSAADPATLEKLCNQFRAEIFKFAGKRDPDTDRVRVREG